MRFVTGRWVVRYRHPSKNGRHALALLVKANDACAELECVAPLVTISIACSLECGGGHLAPLGEITPEQYAETFDINVKGTLFTVQGQPLTDQPAAFGAGMLSSCCSQR